jgi:hypothetical protein
VAEPTREKSPTADTSANQPKSGTYGEKSAVNDLKKALPPMDPAGQATSGLEPSPMPQPTPGMPAQAGGRPVNAPSGVPGALFSGGPPTPAEQPNAPSANPQAARISLLEQLASSQEVSETTREWARIVLEALRA